MPALGRAGRHGIEQFAQSKSWRGQIVQSGIPAKSGTAVNCATHGRTSELAPHQARHIYLLRNKTAECRFALCSKGLATPRQPQTWARPCRPQLALCTATCAGGTRSQHIWALIPLSLRAIWKCVLFWVLLSLEPPATGSWLGTQFIVLVHPWNSLTREWEYSWSQRWLPSLSPRFFKYFLKHFQIKSIYGNITF